MVRKFKIDYSNTIFFVLKPEDKNNKNLFFHYTTNLTQIKSRIKKISSDPLDKNHNQPIYKFYRDMKASIIPIKKMSLFDKIDVLIELEKLTKEYDNTNAVDNQDLNNKLLNPENNISFCFGDDYFNFRCKVCDKITGSNGGKQIHLSGKKHLIEFNKLLKLNS